MGPMIVKGRKMRREKLKTGHQIEKRVREKFSHNLSKYDTKKIVKERDVIQVEKSQ